MRNRYWPGAVLAAIVLVGCARAPVDPPANPGEPSAPGTRHAAVANGFVTVDITLPPGRPGPCPVVISPAIDRDALLAAGFALVDYRAHWERLAGVRKPRDPGAPPARTVGKWLLASPSAATIGKGYFGLIDYDARTAIPGVIDHLATVPEVDSGRIGITGNSTRGFTALQAVARDDRIAVAAVANACGDYHTFLAHSSLGLDGAEPLALAPDYDQWLREREAIAFPDRLPPAALLLVNGDRDRAIPIDCARRTTHALRHAYEAADLPERLRAVVLPGHGHELDVAVATEMHAWLVTWLRP
jgi:dienelactone hydrolase